MKQFLYAFLFLVFSLQVNAMKFEISSPAFSDGGAIPPVFTCDGKDISPPLAWQGVPRGTRSLALIVDDPDAPDPAAPKMTWVHWVVHNLPPMVSGLPEGASRHRMPPGAIEGLNDWKTIGYRGPCPPVGRHRYFFKLYALDSVIPASKPLTKPELLLAMQGHVLGEAVLMGTYQH